LDTQEAAPFFHYSLAKLFRVKLTPKLYDQLCMLVDANLSSQMGMGEFVSFVAVVKSIEYKALQDEEFAQKLFNNKMKYSSSSSSHNGARSSSTMNNENHADKKTPQVVRQGNHHLHEETKQEFVASHNKPLSSLLEGDDGMMVQQDDEVSVRLAKSLKTISKSFDEEGSIWDKAMLQVNQEDLETGWDSILRAVNGVEYNDSSSSSSSSSSSITTAAATTLNDLRKDDDATILEKKIQNLFKNVDSDGTGDLDIHELAIGLATVCGIYLSDKQINALANSMDVDGDGTISLDEFTMQIQAMKIHREKERDKEEADLIMKAIMRNESKSIETAVSEAKLKQRTVDTSVSAGAGGGESKWNMDENKSFGDGDSPASTKTQGTTIHVQMSSQSSRNDEKKSFVEIQSLLSKRTILAKKLVEMKEELMSLDATEAVGALIGRLSKNGRRRPHFFFFFPLFECVTK
jgi:hypothetical protein